MNNLVQPGREPAPAARAGEDSPGQAWSEVVELTRVLDEARRILRTAPVQAESLRQRAYTDGHTAGSAKAQAEVVRHVLEAHRVARQAIGQSEGRILWLAVAILARIAPGLGEADVAAARAAWALSCVQGGRHIRIRVSSGAAKETREMLERWRQTHPEIGSAQVLADSQLEPFCCVVESELGRVDLDPRRQLETVRGKLPGITAESLPTPTTEADPGHPKSETDSP